MIPANAPIFVAPAAGMLFLIGAGILNAAGALLENKNYDGWLVLSFAGLAIQILAFVLLINL